MMRTEVAMNAYETTGTVTANGVLVLDAPVPLAEGKVRVTVLPEPGPEPLRTKQSLAEFLEMIHARQAARGHVPRSREEIDGALREERESWD